MVMAFMLWAFKFSEFGKFLQTKFTEWFTPIHHSGQLCEAFIFGKNHRIPFVKEP